MVAAKQVAKYGTNAQVFEGSALLTRKTLLTCSELAKSKKTGKVVDASSLKSTSPDQVEFSKKCYVVVTGKDVAVPPSKAQPAKQASPKKAAQSAKQASPKKAAQPAKQASPKKAAQPAKRASPKKAAQPAKRASASKKADPLVYSDRGTIRLKQSQINEEFHECDRDKLFLTHDKRSGQYGYHFHGDGFRSINHFKRHIMTDYYDVFDADTLKSLNFANRGLERATDPILLSRQRGGYVLESDLSDSAKSPKLYPLDEEKLLLALFDERERLPIVEQSSSRGKSHMKHVATLLSNHRILFKGYCFDFDEYKSYLKKSRISRKDVDENASLLSAAEKKYHPFIEFPN